VNVVTISLKLALKLATNNAGLEKDPYLLVVTIRIQIQNNLKSWLRIWIDNALAGRIQIRIRTFNNLAGRIRIWIWI